MLSQKKKLRYYWWIVVAFSKKHAKLILLSFFLSVISIISLISLSPYIFGITSTKTQVIGMIKDLDANSIPDSILSKISNGLIFINDKGKIAPALAESLDIKNNGKDYYLRLRKNLVWNDGKPFTAKDVMYKFKDVEVKAVDTYTVRFTLKNPLPIFPTYLVAPIIKYPFIGVAGMYKVDRIKWSYGAVKELYLVPNTTNLPFIVYKFYDNESQLINAYKLGEINEMTVSKKSVADTFSTWKNTQIVKNIDYSRLMTLFFHMDNPLLNKQKDVRQAISESIQKDFIPEYGEEALGPIPPTSWAFQPYLKKIVPNSQLGEKILKKYLDASSSATLNLMTSYDYFDIANQIRDDLQAVGLKVNVKSISFDQPSQFDMLLAFWKVPSDPDQYYFWHSTQSQANIIKYNNVKIDKLLEDGRNTTSLEERKKIYVDFQKTMMDDMPAYFLYYPYLYTVKRK
ncbi:ABC transporter substrate-binding protein [Candidatus Roizmanbacteria bacterium]|nr:ABC transporter substrate-binding protein [Candidatus Roizmanbacteria bacterium]